MILGVTPARGGSKGIPRKNIIPVLGKPLIAYTIECAKTLPFLTHYMVSTDDEEIAEVARLYGAEVPFMRPKELAGDSTPMLDVLQQVIVSAEEKYQERVDVLVLLDPTAPLRSRGDVQACYDIFRNNDCDAVISGNAGHRSPYFNMVVKNKNYYQLAISVDQNVSRRQDSPEVWDLNTVVWIYSRKALMEEKARLPKKTLLYNVPIERSIDIDNQRDLEYLSFLLSRGNLGEIQ